MTSGRPLARLVITLGLLVLGIVALVQLPLDYLPRQSFPELTVFLTLDDTSDPNGVARDWVQEIESAIRSLGRVEEVGGEVRADGAMLTVRFAPGTDPERKAARLESELADLRRRVPGNLQITPASEAEGELVAIVWLAGSGRATSDRGAEAAAEELRSIPGVQAVRVYNALQEEVRVEMRGSGAGLDPWEEAEGVRDALERALGVPALGRVRLGGREWPVLVPPASPAEPAGLDRVPVTRHGATMPLSSYATLRPNWKLPPVRVRFQGEPARALFVWRAHGAPLLAVERRLRQRLASLPDGMRGTIGFSEAKPLRQLVVRLALGLLLASAAGAAAGARLGGWRGALTLALAPPAAVAVTVNAFWLAGIGLNIATLVALALGTVAVLPAALMRVGQAPSPALPRSAGEGERRTPSPTLPRFAGEGERGATVLRRGASFWALAFTALAGAAAVPVTVALGSHELGPLLSEPAQAFLLAVLGAVIAAAILPVFALSPSPAKRGRAGEGARPIRTALRDPGTIVLFAATAAYVAAALFGPSLIPLPADLAPDGGNLVLRLRLPEGTTLDETERRVQEIEKQFKDADEIESFWSRSQEGDGLVIADIRRRDRQPDRIGGLVTRLRYNIAAGGSLVIDAGTGPGGRQTALSLEDRPEADEDGRVYRAVLRSADLPALLAAYDRILGRLADLKVRQHWIVRRDSKAVRLALLPRLGTPPERSAAVAALLRRASLPPREMSLPSAGGAHRTLLVGPAGVPTDPGFVPQVEDLLRRPFLWNGEPLLPEAFVDVRQEVIQPRIPRQSGRFVLPIEVRPPHISKDLRLTTRREIDRSLGQLALPTGADLERPSLRPSLMQRERVRLLGLAVSVPLLLFAAAACRVGSLLRGLVALAPPALGLLAATPLIRSGLGQADDLTVFALAAALALTLPAVVEGTVPVLAGRPSRLYRWLRRETPWIAGAVPALVLGLVAPTLGLDPQLLGWVTPLRAAAVAGGTALLASALLSPALLLLVRGGAERLRHPEEVRRRQRPPAWSAAGLPILEARNLTKIYKGKVTALSTIRFELTPGIVGLLGPNGAGKTTLLRILTGLLDPSRGEVRFRGVAVTPENLAEYRRLIGFLPQEFNAYPGLTAEQFLDHWARELGMGDDERRREIEQLLEAVGLTEHARRKVRDFSGGMRQRVGIARALLGSPPILIVDEPTTGLDVESRTRFRQILLEQAAQRVVLFSTHIASDVEAAASRILLLHRGRLRFDGTPEELTARARGRVFRDLIADTDLAPFSRRYRITARVRTLEGIKVRAVARPGEPTTGELVEPNLEEAYLAETDLAG